MSLFSCCFKDSTDPVIHNIENTLKQPITNASIISIVDEIEEVVLEKALEPIVDNVVEKITGQDISGVIDNFVKKEVEPVIEGITNSEIEVGLIAVEKAVEPIEKKVEITVTPVLNQIETIVPSFKSVLINSNRK